MFRYITHIKICQLHVYFLKVNLIATYSFARNLNYHHAMKFAIYLMTNLISNYERRVFGINLKKLLPPINLVNKLIISNKLQFMLKVMFDLCLLCILMKPLYSHFR